MNVQWKFSRRPALKGQPYQAIGTITDELGVTVSMAFLSVYNPEGHGVTAMRERLVHAKLKRRRADFDRYLEALTAQRTAEYSSDLDSKKQPGRLYGWLLGLLIAGVALAIAFTLGR